MNREDLLRRLDRVREMVRKEFRQIFRDPRMKRVIFIAPVFQLIVFGYAVSTDVRNAATLVVDLDRTQRSRELVETLTASGYFRVTGTTSRPADLVDALDRGKVILGLEIPAGFTDALADGSGAEVQLLVDGTNSNVATVARRYAERIIQDYGARIGMIPVDGTIDLRERVWFNPALESRNYNVPAVIGAIILLVCLLLTSLAVVREREIGTLEQLMVSPLTPGELIAGKTIPFALIGLVDMVVVTAVALLWFRVPFAGNWFVLLAASLLYLVTALGMGLLISTVSATQQEAFLSSFLVLMPTILLSGFMFPVTSMPAAFQWLTLLNPMRHFLEIVRGIFLKGTGFAALWPQILALLAMGIGVLAFAATRFRKTAG